MDAVSERGQASVEHVGITLLVSALFAAIMALGPLPASGLPQAIAAALLPDDPDTARARSAAAASPLTVVEGLMAGELNDFLRGRESAGRDPRLDWSTDGCSAPIVGNSGRSFDFTDACLRHDFGYRNFGRLGVLDERRRAVDERFLADMQAHCATRAVAERVKCLGWARDFYRAVRAFGWVPASRY